MRLAVVPLLSGLLAACRPGGPTPAAPAPSPDAGRAAAPAPARDRRASERVPLRRGGMLELSGRRRAAVNLLDLSEGGAALLAGGIDAAPGMTGALMLDTALLPVSVVAVGDGRIHVAFQPLSPEAGAVLRRLLASQAEPALAA